MSHHYSINIDLILFDFSLLENVEDGACVQLCGQESRITTNKNTEISCNPSASRKVNGEYNIRYNCSNIAF